MKKSFLLSVLLLLIVSSSLFAFENDLYKVNDKGWNNRKESGLLLFTPENSKEFVDPETNQREISDIYIIIKTRDFSEMTPDDYSKENIEKFKKNFQDFINKDIKNKKKNILKDVEKEFPGINKEYVEKEIDKRFERTKINLCTSKYLGKFQSYYVDFYNENFNVIYYSLHTMNHRYQIQINYHKDVSESDLKPAYDFVNSFEPKDIAPTKMNAFLYGNGLKITLAIILIITLLLYFVIHKK